ncbi:TRAP transporter small permease [Alteribacillus sp. HJP-4]|uniref:TRAP transporter small permease n=1 Tax=Alteribacillus sp. HJP-4 TaxID=2775394 RepID=UPI0035CCD632
MKTINKIEEIVIAVLLIAATAVLFSNVVLRYGFQANTSWAAEFIRYAMIWITFIGMGLCFQRGIHVGIDFFMEFLAKKYKIWIQLLINICIILFLIFLGWFGFELVQFSIMTNQITPSLELSMYWVYLIIPVGCLLSILHMGILTYRLVTKKEELSLNNMND